jgi:hypothetical protein
MYIRSRLRVVRARTAASRWRGVKAAAAAGFVLLSPFCLSITAARATEIIVSCGPENIRRSIQTRHRLRNVEAIRVKVDAANDCRVEVSYHLKPDLGNHQGVRAPKHIQPRRLAFTSPASSRRCFVLAGRSYCE